MFKNLFSFLNNTSAAHEGPTNAENRKKQTGLWVAGIFSLLGLVFLLFDLKTVFLDQKGRFDLSDKVLMPVAALMLVVAVASLFLIRRNRFSLGAGLLFYYFVLVPPILAVLLLQGIVSIAVMYIVLLATILIIWVLPATSRRGEIIAAVLAVLVSLGIEYWNPAFRTGTGLGNFAGWATGVAAVIMLGISIRQFPNLSLRPKVIMALVGITVVTVAILASYLLSQTYQNAGTTAESQITTLNQVHILSIQNFLAEHSQDVIILSKLPDLNRMIADQQSGADPSVIAADTADVHKDLQAFFDARPVYDNLRFIDSKGQEVVKVTSSFISSTLQNKATRPFFTEPSKLPAGSLYTSPLELEQDLGKIIVPNRPVIRFATPVYYNNKLAGVVVGNILAENFLNVLNDLNNHVFLVDQQGYYLYDNRGTSKLFGGTNDLKTGFNIKRDLSDQAPALLSGKSGMYTTYSIYSTFNNSQIINFYAPIILANSQTPSWYLVYQVPQSAINASATGTLTTSLFLLAAILLVAIGISIYLGNALTGPVISLTHTAQAAAEGNLSVQSDVKSKDEIGVLASTFNQMTSQLSNLIGTLEQRVADRTRALATSAEVSRRLSTILDQRQLVSAVVDQVQSAFGYYHAHIYLVDEASGDLIMAGGTGDAGKVMLERGHRIQRGRGLVGRAEESNQPVLVADTSQNPDWLPNPLLPDTRSEIAVPISIGPRVLGVLDVQHNVTNGLKQEDVDSLQSIAYQVAVALQNIRQYESTQKIAAEMGVVANVGLATSTITDTGTLLQEVVDLSKKSFNLYHAHIYLLNAAGDSLELSAGAGQVGRQMVAEKRSIPLNSEQSLVARAARTQQGVVVNDVSAAPDFLPNPLLPDTRSEMAVPMLVAGQVIGVLDVQSELINHFTDVDVSIQTTLASQVAVALQNARSFTQAQRQAKRETTLNIITQKIQNTTSIEAALQMAARELGHALGMRQTMVELNSSLMAGEHQDGVNE